MSNQRKDHPHLAILVPGNLDPATGMEVREVQRKSNAEIAAHFVLSPKTVRNHVSNILSKLQVADRAEAMRAAWTVGLGQGDGDG